MPLPSSTSANTPVQYSPQPQRKTIMTLMSHWDTIIKLDVGVLRVFIPEISPKYVYQETQIITPAYTGKVCGINSCSGMPPYRA